MNIKIRFTQKNKKDCEKLLKEKNLEYEQVKSRFALFESCKDEVRLLFKYMAEKGFKSTEQIETFVLRDLLP